MECRSVPSDRIAALTAPVALVSWLVAVLACAGCGSASSRVRDVRVDGPCWVHEDSRGPCRHGGGARYLFGVGFGGGDRAGSSRMAMNRQMAVARARAEIERQVRLAFPREGTGGYSLSEVLRVDPGPDDRGDAYGGDEGVTRRLLEITQQASKGSQVAELWIDSKGRVYALVRLSLESFEAAVGGIEGLGEAGREAILRWVTPAFGCLCEGSGTP